MRFFDFHNDYLTADDGLRCGASLSKLCNSHDNAVFAVYFNKNNASRNLALINKIDDTVDFWGIEDCSYMSLKQLEIALNKQPKYVSLSWNYENMYAYGANGRGKIKPLGREAIKLINEYKVAVDSAHLCKESYFDLFNYAHKIVNSHTCFYDVFAHNRNIDGEQIKQLISFGGLIGFTFVSTFINGKDTCEVTDAARHVRYFADNFGLDNICIGSDYFGSSRICGALRCGHVERLAEKLNLNAEDKNKLLYKNLLNFVGKIN